MDIETVSYPGQGHELQEVQAELVRDLVDVGKGSNPPKQVSALSSVSTIFSTNSLDRDTSQFNAAYDVWFTAGNSTLPSNQFDPGAQAAPT